MNCRPVGWVLPGDRFRFRSKIAGFIYTKTIVNLSKTTRQRSYGMLSGRAVVSSVSCCCSVSSFRAQRPGTRYLARAEGAARYFIPERFVRCSHDRALFSLFTLFFFSVCLFNCTLAPSVDGLRQLLQYTSISSTDIVPAFVDKY